MAWGLGVGDVNAQKTMRTLRAMAAAVALLPCALILPAQNGEHHSPAPAHASAPAFAAGHAATYHASAPAPNNGTAHMSMSAGPAQAQPAPSAAQPARSQYQNPNAVPSGHLGNWLTQHSNLPAAEQERMLRADPSFNRLPTGEQQRLMRQLQNVDQMNEQQRLRRLERSELIERMSPLERMNLKHSNQVFNALPTNRQTLMKRAFQDLRNVPSDQRQTVLNSGRYQSTFSPEERAILNDFLRVEPYVPQR